MNTSDIIVILIVITVIIILIEINVACVCPHSANEQFTKNLCKNELLDKQQINTYKFPICEEPTNVDYVDPISNINDPEVDILEHYRKHQVYVKGYFEDPILRGFNVDSYDNASALTAIGKIPLENYLKEPKPSGYVFNDSPAYVR